MSKLSLGVERAAAKAPDLIRLPLEITIPASVDILMESLETLATGINAGGWATAACVYAFTHDHVVGQKSCPSCSKVNMSEAAFAALDIRGLGARNTVRAYRQAWAFAIERGWVGEVAPGQHVVLPGQDFTITRPLKPPAETPELPSGMYRTIVADPPWDIKTGPNWGGEGVTIAGQRHGSEARPLIYPAMSVEAIAALDVAALSASDAHLYLWTINAYLDEAYDIVREWGFTPSTLLTWCKPRHGIGLGGTYVLTTEHIIFARRGSLEASERVDTSWFDWPRREHSVKPDEFFAMVERVSPGPHLELFSRRPRQGWTVWGNEVAA